MHYPGLIKNRCGVYCYRLVFPRHLRQRGAPREVRFSLGTKSRDRTGELWISYFELGMLLLDELNRLVQETDLADLSAVMKAKIAAKKEMIRVNEQKEQLEDEVWALRRKQREAEVRDSENSRLITRLALTAQRVQGQNLELRRIVDSRETAAIRVVSPTPTQQSAPEAQAVEVILADTVQATPAVMTSAGPVDVTPMTGVRRIVRKSAAVVTDGEPLDMLVNRFIEHCLHVDKRAESTLKGRRSNLQRFLDIVGPRTNTTLGAVDIARYRDVIRTLPTNLVKQAIWRSRPEDPVLRPEWYRKLGAKRLKSLTEEGQKSHFHDTGPFLKWLAVERYVAEDFSDMLSPIKNDADYEEGGRPFSTGQLALLAEGLWLSRIRRKHEHPKDHHFWAPLLALTTGMRSDEIGRLTAAHIVDVGGITMLNIPGTKTKNADRLIPLPDSVLDAGFMQLVARAGLEAPDARLFPEWVQGGGKSAKNYSASIGRWFNYEKGAGLLGKLGIWNENEQVSFHSLRHSFATSAHHTGLSLPEIQMIMGHSADLRKTYGLPEPQNLGATVDYIKPGVAYNPKIIEACTSLRDAINRINFGCDLSGLDWLAWRNAKGMNVLDADIPA